MHSFALCLSHRHEMRSAMKLANPESLILLAEPCSTPPHDSMQLRNIGLL
jgi:hypothetical protein